MRKDERIDILIKEINYWKEHKLLPEVYCNYLLALYTKGDENIEKTIKENNQNPILLIISTSILLLSVLLLSFIVIYFTSFSVIIKISVLVTFILFITMLYKVFIRYYFIRRLSLITLLLLMFFTTTFLSSVYITGTLLTFSIFMVNFISWFIIGRKFNMKFLVIVSILAVSFTMIYILL